MDRPGHSHRHLRPLTFLPRDATDAERERNWPPLMRMCPPNRKYRDATDRVIPLVVREPRQGRRPRSETTLNSDGPSVSA